jgi:HAD superfamily hydrolase (TIGR01509 family)
MIRWVFLDVGNVLLDEDPLTFINFRRHAEAIRRADPTRSFFDLLADHESRIASGSRWPVYELVSAVLNERACADLWNETAQEIRARFTQLSPLIPGATAMVDQLARRFKLGLIANQGRECRQALENHGLLDHFGVVAFSEDWDVAKPDPTLFRHALRLAHADPSRCVMVGDRLDNDMAPAAELGMATVWIRWPNRAAKGWRPDDPEAVAYRDSLERSFARSAFRHSVQPTLAVNETHEVYAAIDAL